MSGDAQAGTPTSGIEVAERWLLASPFCRKMGVVTERLEPDLVVLRAPFDGEHVTYDDIVHGGYLAGLADISATGAAWSGAPLPDKLRGVTVSLNLDFLEVVRGTDVLVEATVVRRGRTLCFCQVSMTAAGDPDVEVARAQVVYKIG